MVAASAVALANTVAAQTRPSNRLPAKFLGCYSTVYVEQPASPCGCVIKVDAKTWTTHEDWTCDKFSVAKRGEGIIVDQTCGGEGRYVRLREYWELHKVANMTLLVMTDAKSLKSKIFVRCQDN
jgi:hypothetical protein